jgi:hypothetical protein
LAARASWWMLQCTQVASGAVLQARYHSTMSPCHMTFAPSVQIPTHLDHQSPFDVTKLPST